MAKDPMGAHAEVSASGLEPDSPHGWPSFQSLIARTKSPSLLRFSRTNVYPLVEPEPLDAPVWKGERQAPVGEHAVGRRDERPDVNGIDPENSDFHRLHAAIFAQFASAHTRLGRPTRMASVWRSRHVVATGVRAP